LRVALVFTALIACISVATSSQTVASGEGDWIIFIGKCVAVRGHWIGKNIFTDATFEVGHVLRGPDLKVVTVRTLGGRVDGPVAVSSRVSGGVSFEVGEMSLVKAEAIGGEVFMVRSVEEKSRVVVDEESGEQFVLGPEGKKNLAEHLEQLLLTPVPSVVEESR
jgi:hypothetical protein